MELKDKLKRLKRERESRQKSQRVSSTWEAIDKEEGLSTKEKLQRLIQLTRDEEQKKPQKQSFESLPKEPLRFTENPFSLDTRYGRIPLSEGLDISGEILTCLSGDRTFENLDLSTALFIDLETMGPLGGAGVIPFNVGMGYYRDDTFWVGQYFLGELAEEERMIQELTRFFEEMEFRSVVTFNGKAFDMPVLETRFLLYRQPFLIGELPHLDFLFPARRLWSHKYENCQLYTLARKVVGADRIEDIPSSEIPLRYSQYLHTGNFDLIEPVLYHNQEDILSLLGVVVAGSRVFSDAREICSDDAMDFFGAGRIMEGIGEADKSVEFFQRALEGKLTEEVSLKTKTKLSFHFKKSKDWEKAIPFWEDIVASETVTVKHLFSFRELAMYFEHKKKDFEQARKIAEEGYVLSEGVSSYYEGDFSYRLERLKRKIENKRKKNT